MEQSELHHPTISLSSKIPGASACHDSYYTYFGIVFFAIISNIFRLILSRQIWYRGGHANFDDAYFSRSVVYPMHFCL